VAVAFRKAPSFAAVRAGTTRIGQRFPAMFRDGRNPMWFHLKDHFDPETLSKLAIIVFMSLFAAAILYQGASFIVQSRTAQLSIPSLPHYLD
jgi:hypothetical protein